MKIISNKLLPLLLFAVLFSCAPPKEKINIKKTEKGLQCNQLIVEYCGKELESVEVPMDSSIEMVFTGLSGFRVYDNNIIYIGGALTVRDSTGNVIFELGDVFIDNEYDGVDKDLVFKRLGMVLQTGSPMKKGCNYVWENKIWDKKANRKITGTIKFKVI